MANYNATSRTNYFRVTDEEAYAKLFARLCAESNIEDFTKEKDGIIWHGFGAYDAIDYKESDDEDAEYDFDGFLKKLQKILPEDEAFMYFESGYEKLRYVSGYVTLCTKNEIHFMSLDTWAKQKAKELLGEDFETKTDY